MPDFFGSKHSGTIYLRSFAYLYLRSEKSFALTCRLTRLFVLAPINIHRIWCFRDRSVMSIHQHHSLPTSKFSDHVFKIFIRN